MLRTGAGVAIRDMTYLDVDLWPSALALLFAGAAIVAMRLVERRADKSATLRTRRRCDRRSPTPQKSRAARIARDVGADALSRLTKRS